MYTKKITTVSFYIADRSKLVPLKNEAITLRSWNIRCRNVQLLWWNRVWSENPPIGMRSRSIFSCKYHEQISPLGFHTFLDEFHDHLASRIPVTFNGSSTFGNRSFPYPLLRFRSQSTQSSLRSDGWNDLWFHSVNVADFFDDISTTGSS